ncbi:glycosyltransferase [Streptomyces sp. TRM66268-LWL]|uniref:Glycosyltransferase n=1 Tax=Streptomyces polyasparticus TaxID=2767826 RepID=A0ABR7SRN1_9ACTN|nr:glycosyltransferase [Streptomyces polyasparticus]MBC9718170.1 glycosyltransferase [Streptomyces polyasparticus]
MPNTPGAVPDVSVIVAVYNTMPYLTDCLTSLVGQTIGTDRIEIVAVDDGSTDGSEKELERFAERYPGVLTVVHQDNSGGPAQPSNRALGLARGRYVFFVGADDHLGPEALERMVRAADRLASDVVLGRMVGVNGRWVSKAVFGESRDEVTLYDSALPWALSNTKLFRRALIEEHGLRFPEDLPVLSDQPFTLEACFRARRITVLADYDYYFAVRRDEATNATVSYRALDRLRGTRQLFALTRRLSEPGRGREWIHQRHFTWEVARLISPEFLGLDAEQRRVVCEGAGELHRSYASEFALRKLTLQQRLLLRLAERGALDAFVAVLECAAAGGPGVVVDGERAYAAYPCFRDPQLALPDEWFDITDATRERFAGQEFGAAEVRVADGRVVVEARSSLPDLAAFGTGAVRAETVCERAGEQVTRSYAAEVSGDGEGSVVRVELPLGELFPAKEPPFERWSARLVAEALGATPRMAFAPGPADAGPERPRRHRMRPYRIGLTTEGDALRIDVRPLPVRELLRARARGARA